MSIQKSHVEKPVEKLVEKVELGERSYEIIIGTNHLHEFADTVNRWLQSKNYLQSKSPKAFFLCDTNTQAQLSSLQQALKSSGFQTFSLTVPAGEESKSQAQLTRIYDELVGIQADRRTLIIALGGGVIGDLAGFAAATFNRGQPFIQIPTSLLAAVDSSVGGKVGINHPQAKNLIGAFHQPLGVWIDTAYLETLPEREYISGLAEVIKYGVIMDADFFAELENNVPAILQREPNMIRRIIARSCRLKADVVEQDEFERTGLRAILNYGHTFAHAYEALAGYGKLLHGEAVSIGMVAANKLAQNIDKIEHKVGFRIETLIRNLKLPCDIPWDFYITPEQVFSRMYLDKKTVGGELRFILPTKIGHVETVAGVSEEFVGNVLDMMITYPAEPMTDIS